MMKEQKGQGLEEIRIFYLQHLRAENRSEDTIRLNGSFFNLFYGYLKSQGIEKIEEVTKDVILDYIRYLYDYRKKGDNKPLSKGTISERISFIRMLFGFLQEEDIILSDPTIEIALPRREMELPSRIMTRDEILKILKAPDTKTPLGLRDRAILEVLYSTGIRNSELRQLKIEDIDLTKGLLKVVKGKNSKDRVVPLGKVACRYIKRYLERVRPNLVRDKGEKRLFLNQHGEMLSLTGLEKRIIKRYARMIGLEKEVTCHSFRHTAATHLLENDMDIRYIQEFLGHSSLHTTQRYTKVEISNLCKVYRRYHPRG